MDYYDLIEEKAKLGLDKFKQELNTNPLFKGLLWTEVLEDEYTIEIQIETFDTETLDSDFLCSVEFNRNTHKML